MYLKIDEITNETPVTFLNVGQLLSVINRAGMKDQATQKHVPALEIIGVEAVCEITGYSKPTIYAKTSRSEIPHFKRDNKLFFRKTDILAWMTENRIETVEEHSIRMDDKFTKTKTRTNGK
ncbi:MAG: helix-turn-helix domain-containing protein [Mariniphaga sp.]|nr:helix-turn-helix domain-containing protein [Mariniphaga sp.]